MSHDEALSRRESEAKLEELKALAEKATPGPWKLAAEIFVDLPDGRTLCVPQGDRDSRPRDAAFIAAANPQTVLALLRRVRVLEAALETAAFDLFATTRSSAECLALWLEQAEKEILTGL